MSEKWPPALTEERAEIYRLMFSRTPDQAIIDHDEQRCVIPEAMWNALTFNEMNAMAFPSVITQFLRWPADGETINYKRNA